MKATLIVIADQSRARIFKTDAPVAPLIEIETLTHTEGRLHDRDLTSDLPGRIQGSGHIGHAFEQATDPKQHEADLFAHRLTHYLEVALNAQQFSQLLIVAEPSLLGWMRHCLPERIKKTICFELAKNITTLSPEEIRSHLPDYLPSH